MRFGSLVLGFRVGRAPRRRRGYGSNGAIWWPRNDARHRTVTSPMFQERGRKLSDAAVSARRAVTAKDQMALRTAGDTLVDTCNACHKQFKPDVPTEGIILKRGHPGANY
jgi:hypothetical protein